MACPKAGWTLLLPAGIDDWHREPVHTHPRTTVSIARWLGAISSERTAAFVDGRAIGRQIGRAIENYSCAGSTFDDHVGVAQEDAVRSRHVRGPSGAKAPIISLC